MLKLEFPPVLCYIYIVKQIIYTYENKFYIKG